MTCVFLMVIWSESRMGQYRHDDHGEDAPLCIIGEHTLPFRFFLLFFPSSSLYFFFFSFFDLDFESSSDECLRGLSRDLDRDLDLVRSLLLYISFLIILYFELTVFYAIFYLGFDQLISIVILTK